MASSFDPYYQWLSIPPEEQPPNHYRLLGLRLFEGDPDVISNAADRQMRHVQTQGIGPHSAQSQQLLNELAAAKLCLLGSARKADYDRQLRAASAARSGPPVPRMATNPETPMAPPPRRLPMGPPPVPAPPVVAGALAAQSAADIAASPAPGSPGVPGSSGARNSKAARHAPASGRRAWSIYKWLALPVAAGACGLAWFAWHWHQTANARSLAGNGTTASQPADSDEPDEPDSADQDQADAPSDQQSLDSSSDPRSNSIVAKPSTSDIASVPLNPSTTAPTVTVEPPRDQVPSVVPPNTAPVQPPAVAQPAKPTASLAQLFSKPALAGDPFPDEAACDRASLLIHNTYKSEFDKAKKPGDKSLLAEKMLTRAALSNDAPQRLGLYMQARALARESGKPAILIRAIEELGSRFAVNPFQLIAADLEKVSPDAMPSASKRELADHVLPLIDLAIAANDVDAADRLLKVALPVARKATAPETAKQITNRKSQLADFKNAFERAKAAAETLEKTPGDRDANLVAGKFLCLVKEDWKTGLPLLANGMDRKLAALAQLELTAPTEPDDKLRAGDGWWDLCDSAKGREKLAIQRRAKLWYDSAAPELKGAEQAKCNKRSAELAAKLPAEPGADWLAAGAADPASAAAAGKAPVASLSQRIRVAVKKGTVMPSPLAGGSTSGIAFNEVPPAGSILAGFNFTMMNNDRLASIQAIYLSGKGTVNGRVWGIANGPTQTVLAKKGYAVAKVCLDSSSVIHGFELVFNKLEKQGFDPEDSYTSNWCGRNTRNPALTLGNGQPIIGIFGQGGDTLYGLGFGSLPPP